MIALFAGTGDLPGHLATRLRQRGRAAVICQMQGHPATGIGDAPAITYRIEHLGSLLADLRARGATQVCLAGAVTRPVIDQDLIDAATRPLIDRLAPAMLRGDDGTLRAVLAVLEEAGFTVLAAADIAPDLLPPAGTPTRAQPGPAQLADARRAQAVHAAMAQADVGQACVLRAGQVLAVETAPGTDWMLRSLTPDIATGGLLYKAAKPGQDRRVDLPVIGPQTVALAAQAGLAGIVIEQGSVMVLNLPAVIAACDAAGLMLWVRPA